MPEQFPKKVSQIAIIPFSIDQFGLYSITITARVQSAKQDLRVEIDTLKLREISPKDKPQYNNIPPAWNGTELKGLAKTVIFILKLNKGKHTLKFIPTQEAIIEKYTVESISDSQNIEFNLRLQAEDGDRRSWITFVLIDLPMKIITADVSTKWHFLDGDDVKLIVDDTIKTNPQSIFHKNWIWSANILDKFSDRKRVAKTFTENLNHGIHYIEFWADRTPILHQVNIDLGEIDLKRIPTVDDPEWTKNFDDDSDQMILARAIFGEARDWLYPDKARIAVGWSIRNRIGKSGWASTYREVITQDRQYSAFNKNDENRPYVENPFEDTTDSNITAWYNCYDIAGKVISGEVKDPTNEANHYYDDSSSPPYWAKPETFVIAIKRSDNKAALIFHKL